MRKLRITPRNLYELLNIIFVQEVSKLSQVCYYPMIAKYNKWLVNFIEPKPFKHKFKMLKNTTTICLLRAINEVNNIDALTLCYRILALHIYGNLMRKYIPYCNSRKLTVAIRKLSGNHFFKKYGTEKTLITLGDKYAKRYGQNLTDDQLVNMYLRMRTIINQMTKSLARRYYALKPEDLEERPPLAEQLVSILIEKLQYAIIDDCFELASKTYHVNPDILKPLIYELNDNVITLRSYLLLLLADIDRKTQICSPIWRISRLKEAQKRDSDLYKFIQSKVKHNTQKVSAALSYYYLCSIKSLLC